MPDVEVIVAGAGPAGLTAALFAARGGHHTLLLAPAGVGGAIVNSASLEDVPGFPAGVPGFEFGLKLAEQVDAAGCQVESAEVQTLEAQHDGWRVVTTDGDIVSRAVIVATGTSPRKLGIPREDEFDGRGVSSCANCDGPFHCGGTVAVVGGGDSALVEALELANLGVRCIVVDRAADLQGQACYQRKVLGHDMIEIHQSAVIEEILGESRVSGVRLRRLDDGGTFDVAVSGIFVNAGRVPNTGCLHGVVELNTDGTVPTDRWMQTRLPGLYAVGDVRADAAGQLVSAAGDGATAAIALHRFLTTGGGAAVESTTTPKGGAQRP